ncbi:unnamed protein product [Calypogeia fissa]
MESRFRVCHKVCGEVIYNGHSRFETGFEDIEVQHRGIATSRTEVTKHKQEEELAGFGCLAAGAYAMYEKHEEKVDPEHAARHKLEAKIGGAGFLGGEGVALYERHEKKIYPKSLNLCNVYDYVCP